MSDRPLVSIIVPVYNGANFLGQAIDCALGQSYSNIEIIVVNDGSTDDGATAALARKYGDRIRYFEKLNGGCGSALNLGIQNMRGEFFSWLSHDDLYDMDKIERQIDLLTQYREFDAVCCAYRILDMASGGIWDQGTYDANEFGKKPFYSIFRGAMNGNCLLISKRVFDSVGVFDEALRTTQDYDFFFRMLAKHRILFRPEILVTARVHPEQDTIAKNDLNLRESDELWTNYINKCRDIDIDGYEASRVEFWIKFANHLYQSPYPVARQRVFEEVINSLNDHRLSQVPLVSVVIPFVEVDDLLARAVKFAMMQTYGNLEILLCANRLVGEADLEQINYLSKLYKRPVRLIEAWQKKGASYARNCGMDEAAGELIALLDADDFWHPLKIEHQVKVIDAVPGINVVATSFAQNLWLFNSLTFQRKMILNCDEYLYELENIYVTPGFLFKKTTHRFDESMSICEDIDFFGTLIVGGNFICLPTRSTVVTMKETYQWRLSDAYRARKGVWQKFSGENYSRPHDDKLFGIMVHNALNRRTIDDLVFLIQNLQRVQNYVPLKDLPARLGWLSGLKSLYSNSIVTKAWSGFQAYRRVRRYRKWISPAFYLARNPDVARAGVDPVAHYLQYGWREGRDPTAWFSTRYYLDVNRDVALADIEPLQHYLTFGWKEGKNPTEWFSTEFYLQSNPDVAREGVEPIQHYMAKGWKEGRDPNPWFSCCYYLSANPDVVASGIEPVGHYLEHGWREMRNPNVWFSTKYYLDRNPDVAFAGVEPMQHYFNFGWKEFRNPNSWFSVREFLAAQHPGIGP